MKLIKVTQFDQAKASLDYFNGFHDGFIKRLSLISGDQFEAWGVQSSSERLTLEITIAHYNYQQGTKSPDQLITASFYEVMNLSMAFSGLSYEWSINHVSISEARRTLEDGRVEACLEAVLTQSRLNNERQWELYDSLKFTFSRAEFEEL